MSCSCCCFSSFITCRTFLRELENCAEKPELVGTCFLKRVSSQETVTDSNETRVRRVLQQDFHFVTSHFHSGIFQDEDKNYKMSLLTQQEGLWRDCVKFHLVTLSRFLDTVHNMKFIHEEVQLIKKKTITRMQWVWQHLLESNYDDLPETNNMWHLYQQHNMATCQPQTE